jgi:hypothetical protein
MADERDTSGIPDQIQPEPQVIAGEDDLPRQPTSRRDPYAPEPYARPGEQRAWRAMRLALIPILLVVVLILWAALR